MLAETTELADLQVFPWSASPLTDSNRRPPPYHGELGLRRPVGGNALPASFLLHLRAFPVSVIPSLRLPGRPWEPSNLSPRPVPKTTVETLPEFHGRAAP
jgi:hypothetical protein